MSEDDLPEENGNATPDANNDSEDSQGASSESQEIDAQALADEVAQQSNENLDDEWAAALAESEDETAASQSEATAAPLEKFVDNTVVNKADSPDLDVILDIPVTISMEVGNTKIAIRNLLQLNQGSVIELDRLAGEPLDVLVNGTLIAHGEVVMVNEKFGIRLTDVVSQQERISRLT